MRVIPLLVALVALTGLRTSVPQYVDGRMYITDKEVTVHWDAVVHPDLSHYEYQLVMFDKEPITAFNQGTTTATQVTFQRPRSGNFEVMVRSCSGVNTPTAGECSEWAVSTDSQYASVDGQPMGWWVKWQLSAPNWGGVTF